MAMNGWIVTETEFDPARLHQQETVFALGNGYLGTRGSFEEGYPGAWPATLIHGVYDDVPIVYTELVNCPDWTSLLIFVDGERFRLDRGEVLNYERRLDLQRSVLSREVCWRSPAGQTMDLRFERFASLADPHLLAVQCRVTPLDFDGQIEIQAGLNGYAHNQGVLHWQLVEQGSDISQVWLHTRTRHSSLEVGMASMLLVQGASRSYQRTIDCEGVPTQAALCPVQKGQTLTATKLAGVYTSRDLEQMQTRQQAEYEAHVSAEMRDALDEFWAKMETEGWETRPYTVAEVALYKFDELQQRGLHYENLMAAHEAAWARVWRDSDVVIEGDPEAQLAVRYNLFQILVAAPRHNDVAGGGRASIGAKTLSGFGYRGHVFWDTDIFIVPLLTHTQPDLGRNLLNYRYHTLPGARRKAQAAGYEGAMFAWESADSGDEVTPRWVPTSDGVDLVRIWCGDIELHISTDVAYAVWRHWQATGDDDWMCCYGVEIVLDTAVFWGSRAEWNKERGRYEITEVIGPDEYHEHVDNNAFTNEMVRWHLETALELLAWLRRYDPRRADELERRLDLTPERLQHWADIVGCLFVPHDPESGLIEQFEGFFGLEDVNLATYEPRTRSMSAILGIEGTNQAQVVKQADVLMLLYLLRERFDRETLRVNWEYYAPRTDHTYGSSLGPCIHAILACELGEPDTAYEHFMHAALVDLTNSRDNTADGIHAASAGGLWQSVVFGFGGVHLTADGPVASPRLPAHWTRLQFRLQHRGQWYNFDLKPGPGNQGIRYQVSSTPPIPDFPVPDSQSLAPPLPDIRGVIFDLDGVLTDTCEFHYLGWQRLADEEGLPFDRQTNEALRGIPRRESLLRILGNRPATEEQIQEMMARKNHYYQEFIEGVTPNNLLPGALELLRELKAASVKVAVGSASKNAKVVLGRLGIGKLVDAVVDGYSVTQHKPAPDLFLHAAGQLGLAPEQCVVVEDAESGVEAALAAGMWAVGLGPDERVGVAHVVLPSLEGVHWAGLRTRLAEVVEQKNP
jgi:beta-phosphoglucomutase